MTPNTRPNPRSRVRLTLRAQRCAACNATILRGSWAWRELTTAANRYYCDVGLCRNRRAADLPS